MKNFVKICFMAVVLIVLMPSCTKDEIGTYNGLESINLTVPMPDLSFLSLLPEESAYTWEIMATLQGYPANHARTVEIKISESIGPNGSTIPSDVYSATLTAIIPAGEMSVLMPLTVERSAIANVGMYEMTFEVVVNDDFGQGVETSVAISYTKEFPKVWYNTISGNQSSLNNNMGPCTRTRYEYLYNYLGTIDITPYGVGYAVPAKALCSELNRLIEIENFGKLEKEWLKDDGGVKNLFFSETQPPGWK